MSYFSPNTNVEEKRKILFRSLDFDDDGFLSFNDLFRFYSRCVFSLKHPSECSVAGDTEDAYDCVYSKETLTGMVGQIISAYDADGDQLLSYEEYSAAVTEWDVREFIDVYFV